LTNWIRIGAVSDVPAGECRVYEAGENRVAVFNVEGALHAIDNSCMHRGGPLNEGMIEGSIVTCPWHHWSYDVRTGKTTMSEDLSVKKYPIEVRGEDLFIDVA